MTVTSGSGTERWSQSSEILQLTEQRSENESQVVFPAVYLDHPV